MVYLSQMRTEHPLIVALVEAFARKAGIEPPILWDALDGKPADSGLVAGLVEAFHPAVRRGDFVILGSTSVPNDVTVRNVQQPDSEHIVGAKPHPHPFTNALRARGLTITEWCEKNGLERGAVKSWYLASSAGRSIPKKWAEAIEAEFIDERGKTLVPANRRTWKNGIQQ